MIKSKCDLTGENYLRGGYAEDSFDLEAIRRGYSVETSIGEDNYKKHIDKRIWNSSICEHFKVQVKSRKKISRFDESVTDEYVWIEFKNNKGYNGSIYGEYDIIAFEREKDFLLVTRLDVLNLCERLVDFSSKVTNPIEAKNKIYTRSGREDQISLIAMSNIEELNHIKWIKLYSEQ